MLDQAASIPGPRAISVPRMSKPICSQLRPRLPPFPFFFRAMSRLPSFFLVKPHAPQKRGPLAMHAAAERALLESCHGTPKGWRNYLTAPVVEKPNPDDQLVEPGYQGF